MAKARNLLLAAAGLLCACSAVPEAQRDVAIELDLPLALPQAAVVIAEAMRAVLPFADPVPYSGGAPATVLDEDRVVVRYEQRGGKWLPRARQRLHLEGSRAIAKAVTLPGYGFDAQRAIVLEVGHGAQASVSTVRGDLPRHLTLAFDNAVRRALAVHTAATTPMRYLEHARQFALAGDTDHARHLRDHAALAAADPALRAYVLRQMATPTSGLSARHRARERLAVGDLGAARTLLHTARRSAPQPGADYRLLWRLHRRETADTADTAALASALLAREHAGMDQTAVSVELRRCGFADLVDRMAAPPFGWEAGERVRVLPATAAPAK